MVVKIGSAVYETTNFHYTSDAIQIAITRNLEMRKQVDCTQSSCSITFINRQVYPKLSFVLFITDFGELSSDENEIPCPNI